ncbi:MAG TPA: RNase adapter RapZ [Bacteroidales bacterium]|nr:RNase adapter RapZ [Bacteroidales bacterium]
MQSIEDSLAELYRSVCGSGPVGITKLPGSGSARVYYRMNGPEQLVGAYNDNYQENKAFISFTRHFQLAGIPVPEVVGEGLDHHIYLLTDLGDLTLFRYLTENQNHESNPQDHRLPGTVMDLYRKVIRWLPEIQVKAGRTVDYSVCYPRAAFDRQSMLWDLNYFKYYFLKLAGVAFDEQALEDDFSRLCDRLLESSSDFFLYRDFQSRNIMIVKGEPWFIDYQGGRKGALAYDIASLLYDGKAGLSPADRDELLDYYLDAMVTVHPIDRKQFLSAFPAFILIRILQALGAYGFRGYYEKKTHFLLSIPYALRNLDYLRRNYPLTEGLPAMEKVLDQLIQRGAGLYEQIIQLSDYKDKKNSGIAIDQNEGRNTGSLTVSLHSFSYKRGLPADDSGHGGGFVFDCRALPNPGRFPEYSRVTGRDESVIRFLEKEPMVRDFLVHVRALVGNSVQTYLDRGFEHLMVSFGCTGGQHRSVYCAEQLAEFLKNTYQVHIELNHRELL